MRSRIVAVMAALALPVMVLAQAGGGAEPRPEVVVLKAARLFDGKSEAAVRDGVVVVEGGLIKAVGSGLAARERG